MVAYGLSVLLGVATGNAAAQDVNWETIKHQAFLQPQVLVIGNPQRVGDNQRLNTPVLTEFRDQEGKGRGFRVFQYTNSRGDLVDNYDFERDGYIGDPQNPDRDGIDAVVITRINLQDGFLVSKIDGTQGNGPAIYAEATEKFSGMVQQYLQRVQRRITPDKNILR